MGPLCQQQMIPIEFPIRSSRAGLSCCLNCQGRRHPLVGVTLQSQDWEPGVRSVRVGPEIRISPASSEDKTRCQTAGPHGSIGKPGKVDPFYAAGVEIFERITDRLVSVLSPPVSAPTHGRTNRDRIDSAGSLGYQPALNRKIAAKSVEEHNGNASRPAAGGFDKHRIERPGMLATKVRFQER